MQLCTFYFMEPFFFKLLWANSRTKRMNRQQHDLTESVTKVFGDKADMLEWLFVFVSSLKRPKVGDIKTEVSQWIPWQKLFMDK